MQSLEYCNLNAAESPHSVRALRETTQSTERENLPEITIICDPMHSRMRWAIFSKARKDHDVCLRKSLFANRRRPTVHGLLAASSFAPSLRPSGCVRCAKQQQKTLSCAIGSIIFSQARLGKIKSSAQSTSARCPVWFDVDQRIIVFHL